jgi:hypothetical protein
MTSSQLRSGEPEEKAVATLASPRATRIRIAWTRLDSGQRDSPNGGRPHHGRASALGRGERLIPVPGVLI